MSNNIRMYDLNRLISELDGAPIYYDTIDHDGNPMPAGYIEECKKKLKYPLSVSQRAYDRWIKLHKLV